MLIAWQYQQWQMTLLKGFGIQYNGLVFHDDPAPLKHLSALPLFSICFPGEMLEFI